MARRPTSEEAVAIANNMWATLVGPPIEKGEAERVMKKLWRYGSGESLVSVAAGRKNSEGDYTVHGSTKNAHIAPTCTAVVRANDPWPAYTRAIAYWLVQEHKGELNYVWLLLTREVFKRGWLDGRLADKLIPPQPKEVRAAARRTEKIASVKRRIASWQTKHKRAANALKKLNVQLKRMEKTK